MTLVAILYVREGIVMASDSRLTLNITPPGQSTQLAVVQSDNNFKTFLVKDRIGISTFGQADIQGVPISGYIESFIDSLRNNISVTTLPHRLLTQFRSLHGPPNTSVYVAGYKKDRQGVPQQYVYFVNVNANSSNRSNSATSQNALWGGEIDILHRLINPIWKRSGSLGHYSYQSLPNFPISWNVYTIQDAIDFAIYSIKATIDAMKFQPRPKTVGGPIDVLVIKPDKAWFIQRKSLHGENKQLLCKMDI